MPLVTFKDAGGDTIRFMEVDGTRYPYISQIDQEKAIRAAAGAKARDDDVLLITWLKSGTLLSCYTCLLYIIWYSTVYLKYS